MNDVIRHALQLAPGHLLRVENGQGLLVTVLRGEIWLTEEGDHSDHCLLAGESHRIEQAGLCLIYACEPCDLALAAPRVRERPDTRAVVSLVPALREG
jgi:hypothetical protein